MHTIKKKQDFSETDLKQILFWQQTTTEKQGDGRKIIERTTKKREN